MNVAIGEAWENEAPAGIDQFRIWLAEFFDFGVASDRDDLAARDRNGFGPRLLRVKRVYLSMGNDCVRRLPNRNASTNEPAKSHQP
jgi:hypothetical protein